MKKTGSNRHLESIILVVISFGVALVLSELLLRQIFPIDTGSSFGHRMPHPVFGWVLEPDVSYINRIPEAQLRVTYNSNGWRDVEHDIEADARVFRILVLGDSYMEAYSVELNQAFHKRLEQFSRENGFNVDVLNLGVGGYGTLQEFLIFRDIGLRYNPQLVLLGLYLGNDLTDNSSELNAIRYPQLEFQKGPFLEDSGPGSWVVAEFDFEGAQSRYTAAKLEWSSFRRRLARKSALLRVMKRARKQLVGRVSIAEKSEATKASQEQKYLAMYGAQYCEEAPEYTRAWETTERIFSRLKYYTETIGSHLVVFTVPAMHEVDAKYMNEVIEGAPDRSKLCLEEAPAYGQSKKILMDLGIEYIDLLPEFRKAARDGRTRLFWRSDRHWNPNGHRLAAETVGLFLAEKSLLTTESIAVP